MIDKTTASGLTPTRACGFGTAHGQHDIGARDGRPGAGGDFRAGLLEIGVGDAGARAGAGLHHDLSPRS